MPPDALADREPDMVEAWRLRLLLEAGYELHRAELLARADVDVRQAEKLLENGCPQRLAMKILL